MNLKQSIIFLLSVSVSGVLSDGVPTMRELPVGAESELLSMIRQRTLQVTGGCDNVTLDDIKILLYTRNKSNSPVLLNLTYPIQVANTKKFVMLIHGWMADGNSHGTSELRNAYLERYDCNVAVVDWSLLAWKPYTVSVCLLPKIALIMADFLCHLDQELMVPVSSVHLVGHSLGGQMSGLIGQNTKSSCRQQLGRITALDPAGPLFQNLPESQRLDGSDAGFVDVIHTNEGVLGYWGNCGDADFHVNCGVVQLGCPEVTFDFNAEELRKVPFDIVACHHLRSIAYMAESINSSKFKARLCDECPLPCIPNFLRSREIEMGEDCPTNSSNGAYVLATNFHPPYALGTNKLFSSLTNLI